MSEKLIATHINDWITSYGRNNACKERQSKNIPNFPTDDQTSFDEHFGTDRTELLSQMNRITLNYHGEEIVCMIWIEHE